MAKQKQIGVNLLERLDLSQSNVDRKNSLIRNVKILGKSSPNRHGLDVEGTDYLPQAHEQARSLYEGMQVNVGHPPRNNPDAERDPEDRNGVLFNVKTVGGQTYGDWKLIPSHPMTATFLDCAEDPRLHSQFALSHNAKGYGDVREGRYQISEIPKVRSVDVVCNGGTNASLFESLETNMKKKLKDVLESATPAVQKRFAPLLEADDSLGDMSVDSPSDDDADASDDYMAHLGEMVKAIIEDGTMSVDEKRDKIMSAIKVMEDSSDEPESEDSANLEESAECGTKAKGNTMESKEQQELAQLRGEKKVRDLCESMEFTPTNIQIKSMIGLSDQDRRAMVKELKAIAKPGKTASVPRTATSRGVNVQESRSAGAREIDFEDTTEEARKKRAAYMKS